MGRVRAGGGVLSALPLNLVEPTVRAADWLLGRVGPVVPALWVPQNDMVNYMPSEGALVRGSGIVRAQGR